LEDEPIPEMFLAFVTLDELHDIEKQDDNC